ncbi:MAG: hypothetical protein WBD51_12560 [Burkholderiaceae bacterium]
MNLRRKLLLTAGAGLLSKNRFTFAQATPIIHRVGVLHPGKPVNARPLVLAFEKGLVERGHIFGNVDNATHIEYRFVPPSPERLRHSVKEISARTDVVVVWSTLAASAAKSAGIKTPVVFASVGFPI